MAQQEEGWPLGLQPVHSRVRLTRNRDFSGSTSFNTLLSGSPSTCTDSSSDLDTESTESFFHDRSTTLGSLIGASNIVALSRRSLRGRSSIREVKGIQKNRRSNTWCFSLCPKNCTDAESGIRNNAPSLGQFLAVERRAASGDRRNHSPLIYGPDELALAQPNRDENSLFINGHIAPPPTSSPWSDGERRRRNALEHGNEQGLPLMFACMCG